MPSYIAFTIWTKISNLFKERKFLTYLFVVLAHEAILGYSNTVIRTLVVMKIPSLGDEDVFVGQ